MPDLDDDDGWVPGPALDDDDLDSDDDQAQAGKRPLYATLDAWVGEHLSPLIRRRFGGSLTWCAQWWRHAEAVSRLTALWHEWERARAQGGLSDWWLHHADPHLRVLMSRDDGPFMACKPPEGDQPGEHRPLPPLPVAPSDPALWLGSAFSDPSADRGGAASQVAAAGSGSPAPAQRPPGAQMAPP